MNILPKKSWHVLSKDNIQRVRRDEAEAKAKEEEKLKRAEIAEREARLDLMRKRARTRDGYYDEDEPPAAKKEPRLLPAEVPLTSERGHINFFADIKQGVGVQTTNVDHDKEKKDEQEKYEKRIGLLNYLVDKDKSDDPWYSKSKDTEESAKSKRRKEVLDPLNDMKRFVTQTKKHTRGQSIGGTSRAPLIATAPSSTSTQLASLRRRDVAEQSKEKSDKEERRNSNDHKKIHKEHKSKSKHKKKREKEREKEACLEELRRQRRKREEAERTKAETLLRLSHGQGAREREDSSASQAVEDTAGRYNSQFNPHLVRQRRQ